jgi:hypothetical protein
VIFCREGAVLVNLPSPIRYGLHKLLVYGEREGKYRTKATKDIKQSVAILTYYAAHMPWQFEETLADLRNRGPGWQKRTDEGIRAVINLNPALRQILEPADAAGDAS